MLLENSPDSTDLETDMVEGVLRKKFTLSMLNSTDMGPLGPVRIDINGNGYEYVFRVLYFLSI